MNYACKARVLSILACLSVFQGLVQANNSSASAITLDQNQKLVIVGVADNGVNNVFALTRLNLDGSPDTTFNPSGTVTGVSSEVVTNIPSNPNLVPTNILTNPTLASVATYISGNPSLANIAPVVPSLQFNNAAAVGVVIDANNKIVVAGSAVINNMTFGSNTKFAVARYNNDGTLDPTFNIPDSPNSLPGGPGLAIISVGNFDDTPTGLAIDKLGRIVVVGTSDTGTATDMAVVRLTPLGGLDTTFQSVPQLSGPVGTTTNVVVTPGMVTVTPGIQVIAITGDDVATCVTIGDSNNIFIAGYTTTNLFATSTLVQVALVKILSNGQLDTTFFVQGTSPFPGCILANVNNVQDQVNAIGIDVNHSLVLGGFTTVNNPNTNPNQINNITNFLILRYTQAGELFETVQTNILASNSVINALTFDKNNNIVVSGSFQAGTTNANFTTGTNLAFVTARYLLNGSLDPAFNPLGTAGTIVTIPGIVITNVLPTAPSGNFFTSNDNESTGVITDANSNIYVTGYSNDGVQTNFTNISYLPTGALNTGAVILPGFNPVAIQQGNPGFVFNIFFGELQPGNGVPLNLAGDTSLLSPMDIEQLRTSALNYVAPVITTKAPLITNDMQPTLNGIASPNTTITILVNDIPMTTTIADFKGNWSAQLTPLLDGVYSVIALSTDPLTSINLASQPVSLTIDTEAPPQPVINAPEKSQIVRTSTVTIQGKAKADSKVTIFIENRSVGEVTAQKTGTWSFKTAVLTDGPQNIYAIATDKAGNESIPSEIITFTIETGRQRAPRILVPQQAAVVKLSPLQLSGEGKAGTSINLYVNKKLVGPIKVGEKGRWAYDLQVKEGNYEMYVSTTDKKLTSETIKFTVDFKPPPAKQARPAPGKGLFSGRSAPGTVITLFLDGAELSKVITDQYGTWSYTPPPDHPIEKGRHHLKISITDAAGKITSLMAREITL